MFLDLTGRVCEVVADYQFQSVMKYDLCLLGRAVRHVSATDRESLVMTDWEKRR